MTLHTSAHTLQMVVWGVISAATAGCQSFGGLIAARFFLGFVEAAYFVSCIFVQKVTLR